MYLSASLIVYHLTKQYGDIRMSDWISYDPLLKYPVHYDGKVSQAGGIIYLVDGTRYPIPKHHLLKNMVIFVGDSSQISGQVYPNCCFFPEETNINTLAVFLHKVFDLYEHWNQSLMDSRLANAPVQNLIDLTDSIIPNPMMVIGMDFTIIASKKLSYGKLKNSVLGSNETTRPLVNSLKQDINYEEAYNRIGYFYYPGNQIATPKLCVNISKSNKTIYRLLVSEGEIPLDDTFGFILEYLAKMVSHALSTNAVQNNDSTHSLHQTFFHMLTTPSADYVEISQQITASGWLSSHYYQCILIHASLHDIKNMTLRSICSYVEDTIPSSCAIEHQGNAVVFINLTLCVFSQDDIARKLAPFIRDGLLNAGYSRKMLGHFNFYRQYAQARVALRIGKLQSPDRWIHQFNQVALYYVYDQTTKKLPAYMIGHEKLLELKYADEANNTQLYETTRCFLEHHQSIARTSEALFIHRSTLLYRLEKIRTFLNTDFSDPEEVLYLLLTFYLMDMEEAHHSGNSSSSTYTS